MTRNYALGDPCVQLWTFGMFCLSLQTGQSADEDLFFTRSGWLWSAVRQKNFENRLRVP